MKADQTPEEIWISIVTCLKAAHKANMMLMWRDRFDSSKVDKYIVDPERYSVGNWQMAKHMYFKYRDAMDAIFAEKHTESSINSDVMLFQAMVLVCRDEVDEQFEQQILKEDSMGRDNYDEPELDEVEELDEDELYAKETEGKFDEDEDDLDEDDEYGDDLEDDEE